MLLRKVRSVAPLFALVLLAWTAVDLLDRHACQNEAPLPAAASGSERWDLSSPPDDHEGGGAHGAPLAGHAGDCFCCSAFVDVKAPFDLFASSAAMPLVAVSAPHYVSVVQPHLYRPPIAA